MSKTRTQLTNRNRHHICQTGNRCKTLSPLLHTCLGRKPSTLSLDCCPHPRTLLHTVCKTLLLLRSRNRWHMKCIQLLRCSDLQHHDQTGPLSNRYNQLQMLLSIGHSGRPRM